MFFSNLRFIASENPVSDAKIGMTIRINQNYGEFDKVNFEFPLYSTSSPMSIYGMNQSYYE
jgi:hypothetical protein